MSSKQDKGLVYIVEDSIASGALYASQLEQAGMSVSILPMVTPHWLGLKRKCLLL